MSSILDALKKSENLHSLGRDLIFRSASQEAPPRLTRFAIGMLATFFLLVLVTGVTLFSLYQPGRTEIVVSPSVSAEGEAILAPSVRADSTRDLKDQTQAATGPAPTPTPKSATSGAAPAAVPDVAAPWLSSLPEAFRDSFPPLIVNIHVYSPDESRRILYINNRQVQEGERIQAGALVEEIVQDGVILRFRGQRFKIPRPS